MASASISVAADNRLVSTWAYVSEETTGCSLISHQVGLNLMVEGNVPSTMYGEKAAFWTYMLDDFVNYTGSRSIPQRNRTWRGGPVTTNMRDERFTRARDTRVSR